MIDPKLIRENPDLVRNAIELKGSDCDLDAVLAADSEWRTAIVLAETLRATQKAANNAMAALPKGSPEFIAKVQEMRTVSAQVKEADAKLKDLETRVHTLMLTVPNIPHDSVPIGRTPDENVVFSTHGDPGSASAHAKPHWEIPGFEGHWCGLSVLRWRRCASCAFAAPVFPR